MDGFFIVFGAKAIDINIIDCNEIDAWLIVAGSIQLISFLCSIYFYLQWSSNIPKSSVRGICFWMGIFVINLGTYVKVVNKLFNKYLIC